jgi:hypothetical protein
MRPVRQMEWQYKDKAKTRATILLPVFETKLGKKLGKMYKIKSHRKVNLDEYGTAIWILCNGRATVREIGEVISEQFGDKVEPLYDRLSHFLNILEKDKMIKFSTLKPPKRIKGQK